ncbi:MAG: hypothetical protein KBF88_01715, partial [Polyangiaceae bacterium]|nr:hypothetical protein [Polyangiaceae bacterium]
MDLGSKGSRPGAQIYEALARSGFLSLSVREGQIESFTDKGAEIVGSIDEDELMRFLMKNGGSRYLEDLSETEASWKAKIEGVQVTLSARLAAGVLQAGVFAAKRPLAPTLGSEDISPTPSHVQAARAKPAFEGAPISARKAPDNRDLGFDIDPHMNVGRTVDFDDPNATPAPALTTRKTNITEIDFDDPLANVISKAPYVRRDSLPTPITGLSAPSSPPEIPVAPGAVTIPPPTPHVPELARGSGIPPEPLTSPGRMIRPTGLSVPPYEKYLRDALVRGASDLYLVADRPMAVRIAGDLRPEGPSLPADQIETLANELTPPRLLDRLHEEGGCDFALDVTSVGRFRVNVARQQTGFKIGFRIITKEIPTFESLGLPHQIVEA